MVNLLHLSSSKIVWDNYAPQQMISEYFPVRGRPLNRVKKAELFRIKFEHARNKQRPYWGWMLVDPGNEFYNPSCNALKRAVDFNGLVRAGLVDRSSDYSSQCEDILRIKSGSFGSRKKCKYKES